MKRNLPTVKNAIKHTLVSVVILLGLFPFQAANAGIPTRGRVNNSENDCSPPSWQPPIDSEYTNNRPVVFNGSDVFIQSKIPIRNDPPSDYHDSWYKPDFGEVPPELLKWPHSPTVKIFTTWPSGDTTQCSGMLIESRHVLTAAHCVFTFVTDYCNSTDHSCWPTDLQVFSNYNLGEDAWVETGYREILTWTAWTDNRDFNYDLAAIDLVDPLGDVVGWLAFGYQNDDTFFLESEFEHTSYPDNRSNGDLEILAWDGSISTTLDHIVYAPGPVQAGQSGAGLHSAEVDHIIFSVLSHMDQTYLNTGYTRITSDKFIAIRDWITGGIKPFYFHYLFPIYFN